MLKRLISRIMDSTPKGKMSYEEARASLETHAHNARRFLAGRPDVEPEILYYLATDDSEEVRKLVAGNPATPQQANKILTGDAAEEVRCELARKIGRLVPGMDEHESERVRELAIDVMERLANDSVPRVRAILAEEIKSSDKVPVHIVQQLARDLEVIVSAPILEYSPLLSDEDLIEVIAAAQVEGCLAAIAGRHVVNEPVADAIVASLDVSAIATLLANPNAKVREETLDRVIEYAAEIEAWHQPVVMRPELSLRAMRRIAGFVGSSLLRLLSERNGLDEETTSHLNKKLRERIEQEGGETAGESADDRAKAQVDAAFAKGALNDEYIIDSADEGDKRVVAWALAKLSGVEKAIVDRILISQSGKAITALVWHAKLPMRVAVKIQTGIARLPSAKMQMARDGVDFPLPPDELKWHLTYFGVNLG